MTNNTFKKIQTVTVGSGGAANIDFTSIPQTYTDLKIVLSARNTSGTAHVQINFNGVSTNLSQRAIYGDGSGAAAFENGPASYLGEMGLTGATASVFGSLEVCIPNYTTSNNKTYFVDSAGENNATLNYLNLNAGLWSNSAAITRITLIPSAGSFAQYSTATLYGVSNVSAAQNAYATGGIITFDDTYVYHIFPWSGTFTPTRSLNVDYLVVAGGGGAGGAGSGSATYGSGGGGAGGYLTGTLSLTTGAKTVTVGAGGSGANNAHTSGANSVFDSITSTGGGRGDDGGNIGLIGGSGGGGSITNAGKAGTSGQGSAGGNGGGSLPSTGGGGGGAGGVGANGVSGTSSSRAAGGIGLSSSISGTSVTRAVGGDGGRNSVDENGISGTANTGNGGGGAGINAGGSTNGGNGGSGIVIVRYAR